MALRELHRRGQDGRRHGQRRLYAAGHLSGLATGMRDLDRRMGGLQASDLIIIAGRPGMGKTSLATNIAFNIAEAYVPAQQLTARSRRPMAASSASSR